MGARGRLSRERLLGHDLVQHGDAPGWRDRAAHEGGYSGQPRGPENRQRSIVMFDYLIIGAGFAGSVLAERLASTAGKRVLIVEKRNHIGGNAYDCYNDAGLLIHQYGPHI